jgi:hypothetical protein
LGVILGNCKIKKVVVFFAETFKFLTKNFDKSFVQNFLLLENNQQKNCLNLICEIYDRNLSKILDLIFKDFHNDQDFLVKLLNDELKKNKKVGKWMRRNMSNVDLAEEEESESSSECDYDSDENSEPSFSEDEA